MACMRLSKASTDAVEMPKRRSVRPWDRSAPLSSWRSEVALLTSISVMEISSKKLASDFLAIHGRLLRRSSRCLLSGGGPTKIVLAAGGGFWPILLQKSAVPTDVFQPSARPTGFDPPTPTLSTQLLRYAMHVA